MSTRNVPTISENLHNPSPIAISVINVVMLIIFGWLDYITGDYSLIILYLIPVSLAAWYMGKPGGAFFCFLALITRLLADSVGSSFSFSYSPLHYWNVSVEFVFLLIMSFLVSTLKRHLQAEKSLISSDALTGLLSRHSFFESAEHEVNLLQCRKQPVTVARIDLNDFKNINERFGHHAGDDLLVTVAGILRATTRNIDIAARFGSDEFVVLMPDTDGTAALPLLESLHHHLQREMDRRGWQVSFTIGAVTCLHDLPSVGEIIRKADEVTNIATGEKKRGVSHVVA